MSDKPPPDSSSTRRKRLHRVHSINFDMATDDWIESIVDLLRQTGVPTAGRSEVVRVALLELQARLDGRGPTEAVKFLLERDVAQRLSRLASPDPDGGR